MLELWQWGLVIVGAFLVGISKTGITGLGILAVAIFASVFPARESTGVLLIVLISADIVAVTVYRREASWPHLIRLFPWAAVGVIIGAFALGWIDDTAIRRMIGAILVGLVVLVFLRRRSPGKATEEAEPRTLLSGFTGLVGGFTTMVANAAGPVMTIYLLAMRLPKMTFIGTAAWFFLVLNLFKVPFSVGLGLINFSSLRISLMLAPAAIVGALAGRWLIRYINQQLFESLALILTLVAGVRMLF